LSLFIDGTVRSKLPTTLDPVVISFSDNSSSIYYSDDETDKASETRKTTDTADGI
jgi:hypothetical protein